MQTEVHISMAVLLSIILILLSGTALVFWRLWDASRNMTDIGLRGQDEKCEALRHMLVERLDQLDRFGREYHDRDITAIRKELAGHDREIGSLRLGLHNLEANHSSSAREIALLDQRLGFIQEGINQILSRLDGNTRAGSV